MAIFEADFIPLLLNFDFILIKIEGEDANRVIVQGIEDDSRKDCNFQGGVFKDSGSELRSETIEI